MFWVCVLLLLYPLAADIRIRKFYIEPVILGGLLVGIGGIVMGKLSFISVLTGMIPGMVLFFMSKWTKGEIGEGDAVVIGELGVFLGWYRMIVVFCLSCFLSAGYGIWLMLVKKKGRKTTFPFIPFLFAALLLMKAGKW